MSTRGRADFLKRKRLDMSFIAGVAGQFGQRPAKNASKAFPVTRNTNALGFLMRIFALGGLLRHGAVVGALSWVVIAFSPTAQGTVFDWPTSPGWTAGQPTINGPDQTVDYSSTGQNISVTIANTGATWNGGYPQVAAGGTGFVNGGTTNNGLIVQPSAQTSTSTYIQLTINFNNPGGVNNVSFQLWDVDATVDASGNGFIDKITHLQATAVSGGTLFPDTVDNTHTNNPGTSYNFITGSGSTLSITGDPSQPSGAANGTDEGTVNISFLQPITQISFWYSNSAGGSLTTQTIGIGPLTYSILPETSPRWPVALVCMAALALEFGRRRRKFRV
jgi:hypothetical protein